MNDELKCTCKGVLGHSRQCAMFDESKMEGLHRKALAMGDDPGVLGGAAGASEGQAFDAWFDREYPIDRLGRRSKYQSTSVLDLMQAAWSARDAEIAALRKERDHWKANHDAQVSRARLLIERTDLPLERVRAYEELAALRERIAGMEKDAGMTYEQIAEKLSSDGYSKQADVIRQIVAKEKQDE